MPRSASARVRALLALASGCVTPLAFAPYDYWPVVFFCFAVLFALWQSDTAKTAARHGFLFGLGMFGCGVYWVQISVHQFGLPVFAFSASVMLLFVAAYALYPALVGYLSTRFFPSRVLLAAPLLWLLIEWCRGWWFTGFPWLALGYSQTGSPLAAYAPLAGVYAVSLIVVIIAAALTHGLLQRWCGALILFVLPLAGAAVLSLVQWTQASGAPLRVALIQGGIEQAVKWDPTQRDATLEHYMKLTRPHLGADLVVWPETAVPAFYLQMKDFLDALAIEARAHGSEVLLGLPYTTSTDPKDFHYYNSLIVAGSDERYDKRHLVPFGEYIPFGKLLKPVFFFLKIPMSDFSRGEPTRTVITAAGIPLGASICYEDAFGEEVIDALPAAKMLVNVSNDAWFGDSVAPHQHLQIAQMRALESGRYLLRSTNNGITAIIDQRGRISARAAQFVPATLVGEAQPYSGATPYVRFGNAPILLLALALLVLLRRNTR